MNATIKIVRKPGTIKQDGTINIRLRLTINREVKYFPLYIFVNPKHFANGKVLRGDPEYHNKNLLITKNLNKANNIIFDYKLNDTPITFHNFERDFSNKAYGSESFYDFVDNLRIELKEKLAPGTIKGYKDQTTKLKDFRAKLLFKDIDEKFVAQYELFMIKRGNKKTTITKSMKFIQSILNKAKAAGHIKENVFDNIKLGRTDGHREFLTNDELIILENIYKNNELKPNKNNVLRFFLFCCYTGLRYSDVESLTFENVHNNKYISIKTQQKTSESVLIPLIPKAIQLLPKKYFKRQKVFRVYKNQTTNKYLKDIMKYAKINKTIRSHCGRHTFATLSKSFGIDYDVISKILGHTDIRTTKIYTKYELSLFENEMEKWES